MSIGTQYCPLTHLAAINSDLHAIANMPIAQEKREAEEEKEEAMRTQIERDIREKLEREHAEHDGRDRSHQRRPNHE